jgi:hypothetical protein
MKKKIIYLLLFCGSIIVSLFFTQCREDELETEPVTFGIKKEKIEYLRGEKALKIFQKIEKIAETSNKFRFLNKNGSHAKTANQGTIDYSEIMQVSDNQGNTNYTLRVLNHPNDNATTFHNVVVNMEDPNNQKVILMRLSNTNFQFQTVSSNATVTYTSLLDNPCPPITIPIEDSNNPPNGSGGGPGGGNSGGGDSGNQQHIEAPVYYCNSCNFSAKGWDNFKNHTDENGMVYGYTRTLSRTSINSNSQLAPDPCLPNGSVGVLIDEVTLTPCHNLNKISFDFNLTSSLNELKNQTHLPIEKGFAIEKNPTNGTFKNPTPASADPIRPEAIAMNSYLGGDFIGLFHTHPPFVYPMFTHGDIDTLFWLARRHNSNGTPKNYGEYFITMTAPQGTYAIKIKDWAKFQSLRNNRWKGDKGLEVMLQDNFLKRDIDGDINLLIKDILDIFKTLDAGIGLYKSDDSFGNWSEIVHELNPMSPNFGQPKLIPCN